jgi:hypothetical protein
MGTAGMSAHAPTRRAAMLAGAASLAALLLPAIVTPADHATESLYAETEAELEWLFLIRSLPAVMRPALLACAQNMVDGMPIPDAIDRLEIAWRSDETTHKAARQWAELLEGENVA